MDQGCKRGCVGMDTSIVGLTSALGRNILRLKCRMGFGGIGVCLLGETSRRRGGGEKGSERGICLVSPRCRHTSRAVGKHERGEAGAAWLAAATVRPPHRCRC